MVHTLPPWTFKHRMSTIFGQIDIGELAARLGSIDNYDRRGNVIFMEDFEDNINRWFKFPIVGASSIAVSTERSRTGASSMKMTHSATDAETLYANNFLPIPVSGRFGLELSWTRGSNIDELQISIKKYDGTKRYDGIVKVDFANSRVRIYVAGGNWTDVVTSKTFYTMEYCFHTLKLVIDTATNKYVRLLLNNTEYDISASTVYSTTDTTGEHFRLQVQTLNGSAAANYTFIDDIVFTQNEL